MKTLTLFPDTNLFVQCKPLDQLNWALFTAEEIRLIITRPVQAEIDSQKGRGSGRLAKRARSASSLFRELLQPDIDRKMISSNPPVVLLLRQDLKAQNSLAEQLDYRERDDQLIGIAAGYAAAHPEEDVRVLTHDTGPMASARLVGLPFAEIPQEWLLAAETDESEKRINKLAGELLRYQKSEPAFTIGVDSESVGETTALKFEIVRYTQLTLTEITDLMSEIRARFPMANEFGPDDAHPQPAVRGEMVFIGAANEVYTPATEKEIEKYKNERYPAWLDQCENALQKLHENLKTTWPRFTIHLCNEGSRPAFDALVSIKANGRFLIAPPSKEPSKLPACTVRLPNAPMPPVGRWSKRPAIGDALGGLRIGTELAPNIIAQDSVACLPPIRPISRDPNAFYYKPARPSRPVSGYELECAQWRHQTRPEAFDVKVFTGIPGVVKGTIEVGVHATNMASPFISHVPIEISVKTESALKVALDLIEQLKVGTRLRFGTFVSEPY